MGLNWVKLKSWIEDQKVKKINVLPNHTVNYETPVRLERSLKFYIIKLYTKNTMKCSKWYLIEYESFENGINTNLDRKIHVLRNRKIPLLTLLWRVTMEWKSQLKKRMVRWKSSTQDMSLIIIRTFVITDGPSYKTG